ncbi:hypothetical protein BLNAU_1484 [Blattamonas nauphoetae]|uniref:RING-type domain-containing protein n=1 Tax=Blattamonas nauphoetae TaxID=2049346 RepID=A0ABQ9YI55_9EUKA|nr:hypothetical protein BLNAU_1484 [Blattamonas nauphoetae]
MEVDHNLAEPTTDQLESLTPNRKVEYKWDNRSVSSDRKKRSRSNNSTPNPLIGLPSHSFRVDTQRLSDSPRNETRRPNTASTTDGKGSFRSSGQSLNKPHSLIPPSSFLRPRPSRPHTSDRGTHKQTKDISPNPTARPSSTHSSFQTNSSRSTQTVALLAPITLASPDTRRSYPYDIPALREVPIRPQNVFNRSILSVTPQGVISDSPQLLISDDLTAFDGMQYFVPNYPTPPSSPKPTTPPPPTTPLPQRPVPGVLSADDKERLREEALLVEDMLRTEAEKRKREKQLAEELIVSETKKRELQRNWEKEDDEHWVCDLFNTMPDPEKEATIDPAFSTRLNQFKSLGMRQSSIKLNDKRTVAHGTEDALILEQERVRGLEKETEELKRKGERMEDQIGRLEKERSEMIAERQKMREDLKTWMTKATKSESDAETARIDAEKKAETIKKLKNELTTAHIDVKRLSDTVQQLEADKAELKRLLEKGWLVSQEVQTAWHVDAEPHNPIRADDAEAVYGLLNEEDREKVIDSDWLTRSSSVHLGTTGFDLVSPQAIRRADPLPDLSSVDPDTESPTVINRSSTSQADLETHAERELREVTHKKEALDEDDWTVLTKSMGTASRQMKIETDIAREREKMHSADDQRDRMDKKQKRIERIAVDVEGKTVVEEVGERVQQILSTERNWKTALVKVLVDLEVQKSTTEDEMREMRRQKEEDQKKRTTRKRGTAGQNRRSPSAGQTTSKERGRALGKKTQKSKSGPVSPRSSPSNDRTSKTRSERTNKTDAEPTINPPPILEETEQNQNETFDEDSIPLLLAHAADSIDAEKAAVGSMDAGKPILDLSEMNFKSLRVRLMDEEYPFWKTYVLVASSELQRVVLSLKHDIQALRSSNRQILRVFWSTCDALRICSEEASQHITHTLATLHNIQTVNEAESVDLCCPRCLQLFSNPVTLIPCGHTLCRVCAYQSGRDGRTQCPVCPEGISRGFVENGVIESMVHREGVKDQMLAALQEEARRLQHLQSEFEQKVKEMPTSDWVDEERRMWEMKMVEEGGNMRRVREVSGALWERKKEEEEMEADERRKKEAEVD